MFLADDTRLRRRVAVKLLHQGLADDEAFLRRFRAEAQAAAALNHPHILAVYDWGEDDHEPYLVTEFLGGGSLRGMLDNGRRLSPSQALLVGLEAARALDHAHKRGFVHRDIKPANLLFGEEGRLRIADFGLARALAEAAWTEPAGAMLGTARYACPEQARGEAVDGRGDVYSMALVLIEAVTGQVPFAADTTIATLMARVDKPIEVPPELGPLRKVLERAGRPDPDERPDAAEFTIGLLAAAEDLDPPKPLPLAGAPGGASDPTIVDRDPTLLPPQRVAGPPAGAPPDGGSPDTEVPVPPAVQPPPAPPSKRQLKRAAKRQARDDRKAAIAAGTLRRRRWPLIVALSVLGLAMLGGGGFAVMELRVPSHPVPQLVQLTEAQARAQIDANHWKVKKLEDRRDGTKAGEVIGQDPAPGSKLKEDKTVTITVSLGNTLTPVPGDLVGKPIEEVTAALQAASLALGTQTEEFSEDQAAGIVLSLDPNTPPQLPKGDPVNVVVSKGPKPRVVPSLPPGSNYDQAAAAISGVQLVPQKGEDFSDTVPAGQVIALNPASGTQVPRDSTVNVVVSKGPQPIPIPDVRGKNVIEATNILQAAGFTVTGVSGNPFQNVTATNPPIGTLAQKGSGVQLITR